MTLNKKLIEMAGKAALSHDGEDVIRLTNCVDYLDIQIHVLADIQGSRERIDYISKIEKNALEILEGD